MKLLHNIWQRCPARTKVSLGTWGAPADTVTGTMRRFAGGIVWSLQAAGIKATEESRLEGSTVKLIFGFWFSLC
jgi:hypothetical protein